MTLMTLYISITVDEISNFSAIIKVAFNYDISCVNVLGRS